MGNVDIKLDDEFVKNKAKNLDKWCEDLQKGFDKYIKIMQKILDDSIMEGETANSLEVYISFAKTLNDLLAPIGEEVKGICVNYLSEIDEADSYLY